MNEKNFIYFTCKEIKRNLDHVRERKDISLFFNYEYIHRGIAIASLYAYGENVYDIIIRMNNAFSELAWKNFI